MKHFILFSIMLVSTSVGHAQKHVIQAIDELTSRHQEWIVSYSKKETQVPSGTQTSRVYHMQIADPTAVDSLLAAFDADKMAGYSYIRTSAAYNLATNKRRRTTVTLQNGERLESHSTEYSFVSLAVIDPKHSSFRTNYILKWRLPKNGQTEAQLYILFGPRPNHQ